jgi:hypothetical protein
MAALRGSRGIEPLRSVWLLLVCALAFVTQVSAAGKPEVTTTRFRNMPTKLHYFDDSTVS